MTEATKQYVIGMAFGVFDGFHPGHQHFLSEALKHCRELIVVVARPEIVLTLKNRAPLLTLSERIKKIQSHYPTCTVIPGDSAIGTWSALKEYRPDIIFLGYDQKGLKKELTTIGFPHTTITAHHPNTYKSSLLHNARLGSLTPL